MPIARGFMNISRHIIQYETTTSLVIIPSNSSTCGNLVYFTATVNNNLFPNIIPTGTIIIKDGYNNQIGDIATLSNGQAIIESSLTLTPFEGVKAIYSPINSRLNYYDFISSSSSIQLYTINPIITSIASIVTPTPYICYYDNIIFSANISSLPNNEINVGSVIFNIYKDDSNYLSFGPFNVISNIATCILPSGTLSAEYKYVQAIYSGSGCFQSCSSQSGTSGTLLNIVNSATTTITAEVNDSNNNITYCIDYGLPLKATVYPNLINVGIPDGYVHFYDPNSSYYINSNLVNGSCELLAPSPSAFTVLNQTYQLNAKYVPSIGCYTESDTTFNVMPAQINSSISISGLSSSYHINDVITFNVTTSPGSSGISNIYIILNNSTLQTYNVNIPIDIVSYTVLSSGTYTIKGSFTSSVNCVNSFNLTTLGSFVVN